MLMIFFVMRFSLFELANPTMTREEPLDTCPSALHARSIFERALKRSGGHADGFWFCVSRTSGRGALNLQAMLDD